MDEDSPVHKAMLDAADAMLNSLADKLAERYKTRPEVTRGATLCLKDHLFTIAWLVSERSAKLAIYRGSKIKSTDVEAAANTVVRTCSGPISGFGDH